MKTGWEQVLARYGQDLTMEPGGQTVQAFFQPLAEKSEQVPDEITGIGWVDGRLWLYLGQMVLGEADHVMWNGLTFRVRSCRPYYIGGRLSHYWAALELEREAAECGS